MYELTILNAIFLGALQGLTEFLPVSSSGHLVVAQQWLGLGLPAKTLAAFDVALHAGTLLAVIIYYRRDIIEMLSGRAWRLMGLVLLGTIPAAVIGIGLKSHIEGLFDSIQVVGFAWLVTGVILWSTQYVKSDPPRILTIPIALIIGFAQAFAMIPGISRSGSTIAAGIFARIPAVDAARYSFLLAIPAIGGSLLLEVGELGVLHDSQIFATCIGVIVSGVVGFLAIHWLLKLLDRGHFKWFGAYCFLAGLFTISISLL